MKSHESVIHYFELCRWILMTVINLTAKWRIKFRSFVNVFQSVIRWNDLTSPIFQLFTGSDNRKSTAEYPGCQFAEEPFVPAHRLSGLSITLRACRRSAATEVNYGALGPNSCCEKECREPFQLKPSGDIKGQREMRAVFMYQLCQPLWTPCWLVN